MSYINKITFNITVGICVILLGQSFINFNDFEMHLNKLNITQHDDIEDNFEKHSHSHNHSEDDEKHEHRHIHSKITSEEIRIVNQTIVELKNIEIAAIQYFNKKSLNSKSYPFKIFRPPKV